MKIKIMIHEVSIGQFALIISDTLIMCMSAYFGSIVDISQYVCSVLKIVHYQNRANVFISK